MGNLFNILAKEVFTFLVFPIKPGASKTTSRGDSGAQSFFGGPNNPGPISGGKQALTPF